MLKIRKGKLIENVLQEANTQSEDGYIALNV